ncbi:hypothetical protein LTS08_005055 [Lithohypha guttulata]|nr:hypothetical protein LTS08_005055 [Lithohypha guttulata]
MLSFLNPLPHLPAYAGPCKVGTAEVEIPVSEIDSTTSSPNPQITTIKFRLYYPTTHDASSKQSVHWLPEPQKEWNDAYASFMGGSSGWTSLLATNALSVWNYAKLPAVKDAHLAPLSTQQRYPVCIFSHGLGGNFNTYSSIVGALASCGVICVAPEHRDGSAPISFIRDDKGQNASSIPYQKHSHAPSTEVLNARNAQLRTRLRELDLTYAAVTALNDGKSFTNYATHTDKKAEQKWHDVRATFKDKLNLSPGQVTWAGHSFGAATITQFVKSVFYHQYLPENKSDRTSREPWDWTPLYKCTSGSDLVRQIRAESPVALLDLWTMPLRSETTKWLWELPMPCYHRKQQPNSKEIPNTVAVMSAEFYKWTELLQRTRALLSRTPVAALAELNKQKQKQEQDRDKQAPVIKDNTRPSNPIPELSKETKESVADHHHNTSQTTSTQSSRTPSPTPSHPDPPSETPSPASSSSTSLIPNTQDEESIPSSAYANATQPHLYHVPHSAHLSQSDFGVLFPNLTKYVMKAVEPEKTLQLNLRAILAVMKGQGLPVKSLMRNGEEDEILTEKIKETRWVRVPLV